MPEQLETKSVCEKYVIVADRCGTKKYISKSFPRSFQYTVKLSKAQMFDMREHAEKFIDGIGSSDKYRINNPVIEKVTRIWELE